MTSASSFEPIQRYLSGELGFEDALHAVTGLSVERSALVGVLETLAADGGVPNASLSYHDEKLLSDHGFHERPGAVAVMTVQRDVQLQQIISASLTVGEVAERLGVSTARVRQRIAARTLWSFLWGDRRLMPAAQFSPSGIVPHMDKVIARLRPDSHPLEVHKILTVPQPSLTRAGGNPQSIADFLTRAPVTDDELQHVLDLVDAASWSTV
ncbi:hypothetical protein GOARA_091_00180 [Gordonia araii NBRC 100433]|uniref:DNA-binding protein n=1 Tax=Gordonia araii NBRC 100433 TaxID=1073574 RepID=G7H7S5_9ACTN|nr:hypothetical protein [Gordonia araii]NNG95659.1 hypothetical protein [Gordonia araii NBRC 100433]GAB11900.1 hypothetical protein GOARA_091_00180 [Gordonia araii NBRC 100433]